MAQTFPWPVTDEELVVNRALENVVAAYGDAGPFEEAWLRKAAANLIFDGLVYSGVTQVNLLIPADAPTGSAVSLVVTIGAASSRTDVTLAVGP